MSTNPRFESAVAGADADFGTIMAHVPNTIGKFTELYAEFWQNGLVSPATKELTRLRNARVTDCGL